MPSGSRSEPSWRSSDERDEGSFIDRLHKNAAIDLAESQIKKIPVYKSGKVL